ncbi:MAG TPA: ABC transporter ATP-binding protein [Candidatus Binatia bacterium]|jgi:putative ABC transport system ATP-binding protein|nr:ABC transporter ATP-binding protein [Candidatus Binatia bacterium]
MPLIELKQVHKHYRLGETRIEALKGITLTIEQGEFVAIWGPSGSGKSTLCNLIGMLDRPTSGVVLLRGQDVTELSDDQCSELRNKAVGFIFQTFNLLPVLSALENVLFPLRIKGEGLAGAREKAKKRLTELGLAEHLAHRPDKLSGGQQQRVAIARALITDPALVIADEPTANLDSETAFRIIDLMRQLNRQSGTTFIFSTHDQRLLNQVHRQILLRDGALIEDKTAPATQSLAEETEASMHS